MGVGSGRDWWPLNLQHLQAAARKRRMGQRIQAVGEVRRSPWLATGAPEYGSYS